MAICGGAKRCLALVGKDLRDEGDLGRTLGFAGGALGIGIRGATAINYSNG